MSDKSRVLFKMLTLVLGTLLLSLSGSLEQGKGINLETWLKALGGSFMVLQAFLDTGMSKLTASTEALVAAGAQKLIPSSATAIPKDAVMLDLASTMGEVTGAGELPKSGITTSLVDTASAVNMAGVGQALIQCQAGPPVQASQE